jgi:hypothetical protein
MQKRNWKSIALTVASVLALGIVVLAIHIWWVMKPHPDARTRVMARIDINQPIQQADSNKITAWLYRQKGVDRAVVNPKAGIVIFTYAALKNDGDVLTQEFRQELAYSHAVRIKPTESEIANGCPVTGASFTYKAYAFMSHIF